MATDILTTLRSRVRDLLADTGTLFPDAMIDAAIFESVSDISRIAPRELVHVEVLHSRTITDESFTSSHDAWVDLANKPIDMQQEVVVTTSPAATTYTEDTDYIIDYAQGRIQVLSAGAMADATAFLIDYEKSLRGIDVSSLTDLIAVDRLEIAKEGGRSYQEYGSFWRWGDILWLQSRDGTTEQNLSENDHVRVWYRGEHTKPGASAGSYPAYLDDVVVKGGAAYALLSKHRERNLQAVTDLTSSRTALALADDDQLAIDTLETAVTTALDVVDDDQSDIDILIIDVTTALDAASTALGLVNALTDTPLADAETALDALQTNLLTEAEALLDSATYTAFNTDIETALDAAETSLALVDGLADTPLADAEIALDKVITSLGIEAEALLDAGAFIGMDASIEAALDGAAALLDEGASGIVTALGKVVEHLESDATNPDSAENQLAAGDALINAVNLGSDAAIVHARYAEVQVLISNGFISEAQALISQADGQIGEATARIQQKQVYLAEVSRRIEIGNTWIAEARARLDITLQVTRAADGYIGAASQRIQQKLAWLGEVDRRISIATTYVGEAQQRLGIASALREAAAIYVQEATGRMQQIDRHISLGTLYINQAAAWMQQIDRHLTLGTLYLNQGRGYQEAADREHAMADRFLFDAQERHRDYWEHLQSRVEMSWPNQRQAAVRQNP